MFLLPDLADFPDYKEEPRNPSETSNVDQMLTALELGNFADFVSGLELDGSQNWVSKLQHYFNFYRKWKSRDHSVEEMSTGLWVQQTNVDRLVDNMQPLFTELEGIKDWRPAPGQFDRAVQIPSFVPVVQEMFEKLNITQVASAFNRRPMRVSNVVLHVARPTDNHWKQFFYDSDYFPKHTNTHIDPKEDVVKAMIYLNDVTVDNGAFHYVEDSNKLELDPLQNIFGRAISTGSYCHTPESRKSVFNLPANLRVSHNFGRLALPGTELEKFLDKNLKPVEGPKGTVAVFDPGAGIHQGGICQEGERLALQVLLK